MYQSFLNSISQKQWKRVGLKRRAGILAPLFSIYSKKSVGIGEFGDLRLLVDWCQKTGMSILQLLPLNDAGFHFRPYDAQSGFALEPMYLSLDRLDGVDLRSFRNDIASLRKSFPAGGFRVDYKIKTEKLELLKRIFEKNKRKDSPLFKRYRRANQFWLKDYVLFKAIKEESGEQSWEEWAEGLKERNQEAIEHFIQAHQEQIRFHEWLQWQLFEQLMEVKKYARIRNVLIMGDLPFLASRDSADVWSHPEYFKLDRSSGAPPDAYFFNGQRWGMPPCHWEAMASKSYDYFIQRLKYAENFYDVLRADHVVGFFRLWTIPLSEPFEHGGLNGFFDPSDESLWEERGRKWLSLMIQNTRALISAEDLGTVPECSFRVLKEFAIPGVDVQRWVRDPEKSCDFRTPEEYRENSIAVLSTHDMTSFNGWWEYEAGTVYGPLFKRKCEALGISFEEVSHKLFDLEKSSHDRLRWKQEIENADTLIHALSKPAAEIGDLIDLYRYSYNEKPRFWRYLGLSEPHEEKSSPRLVERALEKISSAASIFSIQLFQDWLALGGILEGDPWEVRINTPGSTSEKNWTFVMPISLESMKSLPINKRIKKINQTADRI